MFAAALLVVLVACRSVSSVNSEMLDLVCDGMSFLHMMKSWKAKEKPLGTPARSILGVEVVFPMVI